MPFLSRLRALLGLQPRPASAAAARDTPPRDPAADIESYIRAQLANGFETPDEVAQSAVEVFEDELDPDDIRRLLATLMPRALADRAKDMASWPPVTDCDRLDAAFEELNALGILARHNFSCCGSCAPGDCAEEYERLNRQWNGVPITGYIYYHQQDADNAADSNYVHIGFGSFSQEKRFKKHAAASVEIARRALEVIQRHGLTYEWDGSINQRPRVNVNWQRRARPSRFCDMGGETDAHA